MLGTSQIPTAQAMKSLANLTFAQNIRRQATGTKTRTTNSQWIYRQGQNVTLDYLSVDQAKPGLNPTVERDRKSLDGGVRFDILFRFLPETEYDMLYESGPSIYPTAGLVEYPVSGIQILFANVEDNSYMHNIPRLKCKGKGGYGSVISIQARFSDCGNYLFVLRFSVDRPRNRCKPTGSNSSPSVAPVLPEAVSIHVTIRENISTQRTQSTRHVVPLGRLPTLTLSSLPFTITCTNTAAFVSISSQCLKVFQIPLQTEEQCSEGNPMEQKKILAPSCRVVMPRSARTRPVYFFPAASLRARAVVVLGSQYGEALEPPAVVYLSHNALGEWKEVDAKVIALSELELTQDMIQEFDTRADCELVPPILDWQR